MFDFDEQLEIGKQGEKLIKLYYESQKTETDKNKFIVRDARKEEQLKGADFFIINNELGARYVEVKTDTRAEDTGNVALEVQIVYGDTKTIGCALKTFPDYLFYWIYPTTEVLYWNPKELNPYIVDWLLDSPKIVETKNKNFFSRSMLVSVEKLNQTGVVRTLDVPLAIVEKNK